MNKIKKHPVLPSGFDLGSSELASWLAAQSVQTFIDQKREIFSQEEISEFEHESSLNGREFNRLADLKQKVSDLVRKGTENVVTITIPATVGTKMLEVQRRQNDDFVERGVSVQDVEVFAIPDAENGKMEFFDADGKHYADRTRELSISEKHKFGGIFNIEGKNSSMSVDTSTGEVIDEVKKEGTND